MASNYEKQQAARAQAQVRADKVKAKEARKVKTSITIGIIASIVGVIICVIGIVLMLQQKEVAFFLVVLGALFILSGLLIALRAKASAKDEAGHG